MCEVIIKTEREECAVSSDLKYQNTNESKKNINTDDPSSYASPTKLNQKNEREKIDESNSIERLKAVSPQTGTSIQIFFFF